MTDPWQPEQPNQPDQPTQPEQPQDRPPGGPTPGPGQPPGYGGSPSHGPPPAYGQPGYGPPPGYGQPGYGGTREHPQGTLILVFGIMSLVLGFSCGIGFLLGPVAWIMGNNALTDIDAAPSMYSNRSSVQAGRICGIVSTAFLILGLVAVVLIIAAAGSSSS
jgi:hypothetical protein